MSCTHISAIPLSPLLFLVSLILSFFLFPDSSLLAQTTDGWSGLLLDESTVEDAIKILGTPNRDKNGQKLKTAIGYRVNRDLRCRKLEYKKPPGMDKAELFFLDGKLVAIQLDLKRELNPNSLKHDYGVEFTPELSGVNITVRSEDYEPVEGFVSYPRVYHIVGTADISFVIAEVRQGTFSHMAKSYGGIQEEPTHFPGKVHHIQLVARSLEKE